MYIHCRGSSNNSFLEIQSLGKETRGYLHILLTSICRGKAQTCSWVALFPCWYSTGRLVVNFSQLLKPKLEGWGCLHRSGSVLSLHWTGGTCPSDVPTVSHLTKMSGETKRTSRERKPSPMHYKCGRIQSQSSQAKDRGNCISNCTASLQTRVPKIQGRNCKNKIS